MSVLQSVPNKLDFWNRLFRVAFEQKSIKIMKPLMNQFFKTRTPIDQQCKTASRVRSSLNLLVPPDAIFGSHKSRILREENVQFKWQSDQWVTTKKSTSYEPARSFFSSFNFFLQITPNGTQNVGLLQRTSVASLKELIFSVEAELRVGGHFDSITDPLRRTEKTKWTHFLRYMFHLTVVFFHQKTI